MSDGPLVSEEKLVFFRLMEGGCHEQALEYLARKPELIDCVDNDGDTPLMKSVEAGNLEMVKQLLRMNANVNMPAVDGFCAIHIAARNGLTTIAEKLLDAGANVKAQTPHDWTPIMCALSKDFSGCAAMLERRGGGSVEAARRKLASNLKKFAAGLPK